MLEKILAQQSPGSTVTEESRPKRRTNRAESEQIDRRIAELCAQDTPGNEIVAIINRERGLQLHRASYHDRVERLGLTWIRVDRRPPVPEIPEAELPICKFCNQIRRPMPYRIVQERESPPPGPTLLCENLCCPTCGGKLELHIIPGEPGTGPVKWWTHVRPLPLRKCENCGNEFRPHHKRPHKMTCDVCGPRIAHKKSKLAHAERVRKENQRGYERKKARTLPADLAEQPEIYQKIVPVLIADRAAGGNVGNSEVLDMFGLSLKDVSKERMNDIRRYCGVPGPRGRPSGKTV